MLGFNGDNLCYDSPLVSGAGEKTLDVVSALGCSLGYLGGRALYLFNVYLVGYPATFGLGEAPPKKRKDG